MLCKQTMLLHGRRAQELLPAMISSKQLCPSVLAGALTAHLYSHRAEGLVVVLCFLQGHLQLCQVLLEAIELHSNVLALLFSPLQHI